MIARAYRVITADPTNKKYDYIDAELGEQLGEVHLSIDLLPNVEGYTDAAGKWICKEDELKVNVEVEAPIVEFIEASSSNTDEKYFKGKLQTGEYLIMKYSNDETEDGSIKFIFDDKEVVFDINVFRVLVDNTLEEVKKDDNGEYYNLKEDDLCYICIKITKGGTGGIEIGWYGN